MLPTIILVCLVCLDWIGLRLGLSPSSSAIYEQCHSLWSVNSSKEKLFLTACVGIIVPLLAMWKWRTLKDLILDTKSLPTTQIIANSPTETKFLIACEAGNESEVKRHLKNNVKLDLLDDDRRSPLHLAVKNKHMNIIKLLLKES